MSVDMAQQPDPQTDASIAAARAAHDREQCDYVLEIGAQSPRQGLDAILVQHPDAVAVLNKFIGLCELHSYRQLRTVFTRALRDRVGR